MAATKKKTAPVVQAAGRHTIQSGLCHCGNRIFDPRKKYETSYVDDHGGRLFHQWVCKSCGFVHREWAAGLTHEKPES